MTGTGLTLIEPIGFHTSDRALKRAGLDYWLGVDVEITRTRNLDKPFTLFTSRSENLYTDVDYSADHLLIFGSETKGLPQHLLDQHPDKTARLPMIPGGRCLNLANAACTALYEALRQHNFSFTR